MSGEKLDCRQLLGSLTDYIDEQASEQVCAEIERHMADCENCRVVVDTLRKSILLVRQLPRQGMPPDARQRLYKSLDLEAFLTDNPSGLESG